MKTWSALQEHKIFSSDNKKEFSPKYGDSLLYEHHTTSLVFNVRRPIPASGG